MCDGDGESGKVVLPARAPTPGMRELLPSRPNTRLSMAGAAQHSPYQNFKLTVR